MNGWESGVVQGKKSYSALAWAVVHWSDCGLRLKESRELGLKFERTFTGTERNKWHPRLFIITLRSLTHLNKVSEFCLTCERLKVRFYETTLILQSRIYSLKKNKMEGKRKHVKIQRDIHKRKWRNVLLQRYTEEKKNVWKKYGCLGLNLCFFFKYEFFVAG